MRKALSVLVVVCLVLSLLTGVVAPVPETRADTFGDFTYTVSGDRAMITGYTGLGGVVAIPATVGTSPAYPVIGISFDAFNNTQGHLLTGVTIPNGVTRIGSSAFWGCSALTSLIIPNSVTDVESNAFQGCTALTTLTIGSGLKSIQYAVFSGCTALTSLTIPDTVTSIGNYAFYQCTGLASVTIGSGVTTIGTNAFQLCKALTSVTIPNSVTSIGGNAFQSCTALASVTIPNSVTSIKDYTFYSCPALTSLVIPDSVESIGYWAFRSCTALTSLTIGRGVTTIGERAFDSCTKLAAAYFLGNAPTMGADVFISTATGFSVQYVNGTTGWTNPWYGYPVSAFSGAAYQLTPSAGTGGTITPNTAQTVVQGGSMSFAITPTTGYRIADVSVDGASQGNVSSYTFTNVTSNHTIKAVFEKEQERTILILQVGNAAFTVNGVAKTLDSPPVIKNGRTLVPIRAIIEALGGTVGWDGTARKATVTLASAAVELWIGKSAAKVNGVSTLIDPANAKVVPEIINGRTMLPVRFVSENLGCSVLWADATRTITITYGQ